MFLRDVVQASTSAKILLQIAGNHCLPPYLLPLLVFVRKFPTLKQSREMLLRFVTSVLEVWYEVKKRHRDIKRQYEDSSVTAVTRSRSTRRAGEKI
jgi:hypothetical protein